MVNGVDYSFSWVLMEVNTSPQYFFGGSTATWPFNQFCAFYFVMVKQRTFIGKIWFSPTKLMLPQKNGRLQNDIKWSLKSIPEPGIAMEISPMKSHLRNNKLYPVHYVDSGQNRLHHYLQVSDSWSCLKMQSIPCPCTPRWAPRLPRSITYCLTNFEALMSSSFKISQHGEKLSSRQLWIQVWASWDVHLVCYDMSAA